MLGGGATDLGSQSVKETYAKEGKKGTEEKINSDVILSRESLASVDVTTECEESRVAKEKEILKKQKSTQSEDCLIYKLFRMTCGWKEILRADALRMTNLANDKIQSNVKHLATYRLNVLTTNESDLTRISKFAKLTKKFNPLLIQARVNKNVTAFSPFTSHVSRKRAAFTLAEVLITLGIIGVVAAMTLPALIQNYQKQVTATRLKQTYSVLAQAIRMSEAENGEMSEWNFENIAADGGFSEAGVAKTRAIVKKYIQPYLRNVHEDVLVSSSAPYEYSYYSLNGTQISSNSHTHYSIALNNGVYLHFNANYESYFNVIELRIDINGRQKPNTVGLDTFYMTVFPKFQMFNEGEDRVTLLQQCKTPQTGSNIGTQRSCGALIQADGWVIKDDYPWK